MVRGTENPDSATGVAIKRQRLSVLRGFKEVNILIALVVLCAVFYWINPSFLNLLSIQIMFRDVAVFAMLGIGVTLVIITEGIDLSLGSMVALTNMLVAWFMVDQGWGMIPAILAVLLFSALVGLMHGVFVTKVGIPSFIITLGTLIIARGMAAAMKKGWIIAGLPEPFLFIGQGQISIFPVQFVILVIVAIIVAFILDFTVLGRHIYATGGDVEAARVSGINVDRVRNFCYIASGLTCGTTGIIVASRLGEGNPIVGRAWELWAIAATVIGGTSLFGGEGSVLGVIIGAAIMSVMKNGLVFAGISSYYHDPILGCVLVIAVTYDVIRRGEPQQRRWGAGLLAALLLAIAAALFYFNSLEKAARATPTPTPTTGPGTPTVVAQPSATLTTFKVLPTPTSVPPPPTPTPLPTPTPSPTPTPVPTSTPAPTAAEETAEGPTPTPTLSPSPSPTIPTPSPTAPLLPPVTDIMIDIPAGPFTMGNNAGAEDEAPAHQADLSAFEIDRFEVTNADFANFVAATDYQTDAEKEGRSRNWRMAAQGKDNHPVVYVSWNDAVAYCRWLGKRLPTEAEWEKAARGTDERIYPWGNEWDPSKANVKDTGLRGTAVVGSFGAGVSPYGVEDIAGNVWEWTADWYEAYPGSDYQSPYYGQQFRVLRGGGWFETAEWVRTTARNANTEIAASDDVGFRCAR
jgi:ribose/xylose/arabinose/galactoside ABC-type transport system permease subunit/formylglycine-generating enzyme required for sulfatase activity